MYAIIQDGGHQYRVEKGQRLSVQLKDVGPGDAVVFDKVCMIGGGAEGARLGTPYVEGATVQARVVRPEARGRKIDVFFYRRRKGSRRHIGHRQKFTEIEITEISA